MKMPRVGSVAKACTEDNTPERTRKVPSRLIEKAMRIDRVITYAMEGA
jgi:hypothetical protein